VWDSVESINKKIDFGLIAWAVLPEHFHFLIDPNEINISDLLQRIELSFSRRYRERIGLSKGSVWQDGFWDHIIRNQSDFNRHLDYIHYNPIKHGIVKRVYDYKHSSIIKFKEFYPEDWGSAEHREIEGEFGEP